MELSPWQREDFKIKFLLFETKPLSEDSLESLDLFIAFSSNFKLPLDNLFLGLLSISCKISFWRQSSSPLERLTSLLIFDGSFGSLFINNIPEFDVGFWLFSYSRKFLLKISSDDSFDFLSTSSFKNYILFIYFVLIKVLLFHLFFLF